MGPVRADGVAAGVVVIGTAGADRIRQGHQPGPVDELDVHAGDGRSVAGDAREGDLGRFEGDIGNRARVPTHVEEGLGIDRLLGAVAVDVLGHAERDVGHVEQRGPLGKEDVTAVPERPDEVLEIEVLDLVAVELEALAQLLTCRRPAELLQLG
ncbi:MAG: hypothetical protein LC733_03230, partial [Actinobacteria bacterium]|nr:hypothetical protein [Actinomycetota bacterium]